MSGGRTIEEGEIVGFPEVERRSCRVSGGGRGCREVKRVYRGYT